ncbi:MAG: hypothetical protein AAFO59_11270 [Cyanobacteria bacterium J06607_17]
MIALINAFHLLLTHNPVQVETYSFPRRKNASIAPVLPTGKAQPVQDFLLGCEQLLQVTTP